jgi:hypothetical protein
LNKLSDSFLSLSCTVWSSATAMLS